MPDNVKKNIPKTKVDYYSGLKKLNTDNKRTIPTVPYKQLPFDKQPKSISIDHRDKMLHKKDSNLENIVEIFDPTGISSWDDIYRSYKKEGMSGRTALEIFGAIPLMGKAKKAASGVEELGKAFAITGRQKTNAKVVGNTLNIIGKYGPTTGRATDAIQAIQEYKNGGTMNKPKNIPTWNYSSPGTPIHPTQSVPFALGGRMYNQGGSMEQLTEFGNGGSHEESPLGGIPQGTNAQGQTNLVEEGETKLNSKDYIFSDSLKVDKETAEAFNLPSSSNGKTFAEVSKGINSKNSFRTNDSIDNNHKTKLLDGLMEAQEAYKMKQAMIKMQELQALMPQGMTSMGQFAQPQGMEQPMPEGQAMEGQEQMPQELLTIEQMRCGGNMYDLGGQFTGGQNVSGNWTNTQDLSSGQNNLITPGVQPTQYTIDPNQASSNYGMSAAGEGMNPAEATNSQGIKANNLGTVAGIATGAAAGFAASNKKDAGNTMYNTALGGVSAIPGPVGMIGKGIGIVDTALAPVKANAEKTNTQGYVEDSKKAQMMHNAGVFLNPAKAVFHTLGDKNSNAGEKALSVITAGGSDALRSKDYVKGLNSQVQNNRQFYNNGGYMDSVSFTTGGGMNNGEPPYGLTPEEYTAWLENPDNQTQIVPTKVEVDNTEAINNLLNIINNPSSTVEETIAAENQLSLLQNPNTETTTTPTNTAAPTVQDVEAGLATYDADGNIVWIPEQSKKLGETQGVNLEANKFNQIGQMVPVAYNTAMGIGTMFQKPTQLSAEDYLNNGYLNAAKMNIQAPLREVDRDFTTTQKAVKAGTSGGTYLAMLNGLNNQVAQQRANLYNTKENFDSQMQMDADKFNIGLQGQNKGLEFQIADWNARSKAAKQAMTNQYLSAASTQVGQIARANREDQLGIEYAKLAGPDVSKGIDSYNPYWFNMKSKKNKDNTQV